MLGFAKLNRDLTMLCRVNLSLGGDWLKSQFTSSDEKMDSTFQLYAKFHHIGTMNDASNQIHFEKNIEIYMLKHVRM